MAKERISDSIPSKKIEVFGSNMHYLEAGQGDPILLLHSIPLSSYSWRHIIPHLAPLGRCIAPDLMGFGLSDKPDITYSVVDHIRYIEKFIETLKLHDLTLIMHGWGSVIGFNYAMAHEKNCKALIFYEAFLHSGDSDDVSLPYLEQAEELQSTPSDYPTASSYVDHILPQQGMKKLSHEDMKQYRQPFLQPGSEKPILKYIQEMPIGNGNKEIEKLINNYTKKLAHSKLPKLMLYTVPGFITTMGTIMWAKEHLPNVEVIDLGEELHLAQEADPKMMGESISVWLQGLEANNR